MTNNNPNAFQNWVDRDTKPLNAGPLTDDDALIVLKSLTRELDWAIEENNPKNVAKKAVKVHSQLSWLKNCIDVSDPSQEVKDEFIALAKRLMSEAFGIDPNAVIESKKGKDESANNA